MNQPLSQRFRSTALWTAFNHVATQGLRLASNLLLAKLLAPDLFGVMALAYTVMYGLYMMTDSGVATVGVQSPRGAEPRFLNVLWTIEVGRGALIAGIAISLAAVLWTLQASTQFLAGSTYADPRLPWVIAAVSLTALPQGLESTKKVLARRNLQAWRITRIELESQVLTVLGMLVWAALSPDIWALAVPPFLGATYKAVVTHTRLEGPDNRFAWDRTVGREIVQLGKWVFLSSIITFLINSADKIFLAAVLPAEALGHYSIAFVLATAMHMVCSMLGSHAFTPAFSEINRIRSNDLAGAVRRSKLWLNLACALVSVFISLVAPAIIGLMYDNRYSEVAWMLSMLAFTLIATPASIVDSALIAKGNTRALAWVNFVRLLAVVLCLALGYLLGGKQGAVAGVSVSSLVSAIASSHAQVRAELTDWRHELELYAVWAAAALLCLLLHART